MTQSAKSKKVLILSNMGPSDLHPEGGQFVVNQVAAVKKYTDDVDVDFFYLTLDKRNMLHAVLRYPLFLLRFIWKYVFSFQRLDVIHVHFYFPTILLAVIYRLFRNSKVKILVTFHGSDVYAYQPPSKIYRAMLKYVDEGIFVSEQLRIRANLPIGQQTVLSAGIKDDFRVLGRVEKRFDFIFVGRLIELKGAKRLIKLLENMPENMTCVVVGRGPYATRIEELSEKQSNIHHVDFASPTEIAQLMNASRLLINLSAFESFGLVMTEANACGIPVLATDTDGAQAQIRDGQNGFIVPNDDAWIHSNIIDAIIRCQGVTLDSVNIARANTHRLSNIAKSLIQRYI
ncbi:glycosyltransferase [Aestuariibacter sp. AA17]|uniref:Glycosyltransferase n=1 Tax=Fluctibacter corallii TaxID=2984329 RepID=A0ABT3A3M3_9ALTE|nr:glycosyltransferase [Aestuariibacter sp. AA17]MCV2883274.1 glycosyltransferase [Aestuariibacter sp. AA17]